MGISVSFDYVNVLQRKIEMPFKSPHPCNKPGCPHLTKDRFCPQHEQEEEAKIRKYDRRRDEEEPWRQWIHSPRWRKESKRYLNEHPLCGPCLAKGIEHGANVVDHKIPHKGDYDLFWNESNWQAMAKRCHDIKTAKEDGGWGWVKSPQIGRK